jgi:hypothetical protein
VADNFTMIDRLLSGALNTVIMTLIGALAAAALVCAHGGALRLMGGAASSSIGFFIAAIGSGIAAALLIRHRNDLADR